MLIGSSENYSGYPHTKVQNNTCGSLTELKISLQVMTLSNESGIHHQPKKFIKISPIQTQFLHVKLLLSIS